MKNYYYRIIKVCTKVYKANVSVTEAACWGNNNIPVHNGVIDYAGNSRVMPEKIEAA